MAGVSILAGTSSGTGRECTESQKGVAEIPAAGGKRDKDPVAAEADDVVHAVAVHVCKLARIAIVAGPAGIGTKSAELQHRVCEMRTAGRERDKNSRAAEADDVGHAIAV